MEKNIINPDFVTDVHMTDKVLSVEQLKKIVEKAEPYIYLKIKKHGFLGSRDYPFITYANFHKSKKCAMSEEIYPAIMKTEEEKNSFPKRTARGVWKRLSFRRFQYGRRKAEEDRRARGGRDVRRGQKQRIRCFRDSGARRIGGCT